jgi:hypothetical protein
MKVSIYRNNFWKWKVQLMRLHEGPGTQTENENMAHKTEVALIIKVTVL